MNRPLLLTSLALLAFAACGKKDPAPPPAPATAPAPTSAPTPAPTPTSPDGTAAADPTPEPEPEPPPAPIRKGFVAWAQNPDGELETALFLDGESAPLATRKGTVAVAHDTRAFRLDRETSSIPLKPCDDEGEAGLVALAVTGVEPTFPKKTTELVDIKLRPKPNESWIHSEKIDFIAQLGPIVLMHHEANSDTCPIPAGGAVYDVLKVIDLSAVDADRGLVLADPKSLFTPEELAAAETKALAEGKALVKKEYPAIEDAELDRILKLYDMKFGWTEDGKVTVTAVVAASSVIFSDIVDEEGYVAEKITLDTIPAALQAVVSKVPAPVLAFWKSHSAEGRGFSPVSGQAFETLALWLSSD